ncbi:MAG TPA: TonB-dependent receptor plug domain-containing protein [Thermoanaerobaculia bacterium]|nr:TonB-dependent receptor plug domain-containing protein [Thermoanaerobaculia bacterium]
MHNVASIEVVRGPASVLYGSDAIGGVMNAVSSEPQFNGSSNLRLCRRPSLVSR